MNKIYKLTPQQIQNRNNIRAMRSLVRINPDRYQVRTLRDNSQISFYLIDNLEDKLYQVVIEDQPNDFAWKWRRNV